MAMENNGRDLILAPGEYAYVQELTKGQIYVNVGPFVKTLSQSDQPVVWDSEKLKFRRCDNLDQAIQRDTIAPEGFYLALYNPSKQQGHDHPVTGTQSQADLDVGHRINVPGPACFPLWPGQMAEVIRGHNLRSNQYLIAQVYNDAEATTNWKHAVVKVQKGGAAPAAEPRTFAPGQLMVIKGTEVAFFIPPTGVKVVPETPGQFVRAAETLERLEYCVLLGESGEKRYVQGPAVVFPEPTERFIADSDGVRKFRAIELNENTGLYVKVIADYEDEDGTQHAVGEELFITGTEQPIYFQREEHSVIRYDGQTKHYAVAIPAGEGRYVLDRQTGAVRLAVGPQMLLCDPRTEVIVRRVLDPKTAALWYPGNVQAVQVNAVLEAEAKAKGSTAGGASAYDAGRSVRAATSSMMMFATESVTPVSTQVAGDKFNRGGSFTPPRTITLDTKYEGAVAVAPWSGYAVMVMDKSGHRRVVAGPTSVLLAYDETLAPMELSTGTPKTDAVKFSTVYLRTKNNKVSDRIMVETKDMVHVTLTLSYRVNFEGEDQERWFAVENYVQLLCDHVRSLVRNAASRLSVMEFYGKTIDVVRDAVLGAADAAHKRPGRAFDENGMRVYDVEVLGIAVDANVANLLGQAQSDTLTTALRIEKERRDLAATCESETFKQGTLNAKHQTDLQAQRVEQERIKAVETTERAKADAAAAIAKQQQVAEEAKQAIVGAIAAADLARREALSAFTLNEAKEKLAQEIEFVRVQTEEIVKRTEAIDANLATALTAFADAQLTEKIAVALAPMAAMNGVSAADVLGQLLKGTPLEAGLKALGARTRMPALKAGE